MNLYIISNTFFNLLIILMSIIAFAIIIIMISLAILFGCKVAQKVHDKDHAYLTIKSKNKKILNRPIFISLYFPVSSLQGGLK